MSTETCSSQRCAAPPESANRSGSLHVTRGDWLIVAVLVTIGAIVRVDFLRATAGVIDADEAIVGLMAKHILEGREIPIFYYGQHYMGSLEALMASVSFRIFGPSSWALQLVPLVWSLALIVVVFLLGCACGGRVVGRFAALLTAVPPVSLVVWSIKARGGFIELLVLGAAALLVALRWWQHGRPCQWRYPAGLGMLLGIGWWVNNQILYFILPIAAFSALYIGAALWRRQCRCGPAALVVMVGSVSFLFGGSLYWWYNLMRGFPSLGMFGRAPKAEILAHLKGVFDTALPILLGARHFWERSEVFAGATAVYYAVYGLIFVAVIVARWQGRRELWQRGGVGAFGIELLLLFVLCAIGIFSCSTFGWLVQAPRYLLPLYVGLSVVCGYFCAGALRRSRVFGVSVVVVLFVLNLSSSYAGGRALPGEPVVFSGERVARDHTELIETLNRLGITRVRANYWIGYRLAFETQERVTFVVSGEPHQVRIPEYEHGLTERERAETPFVAVEAEARVLRNALHHLGYTFQETQASGYTLLYGLRADMRELRPVQRQSIARVQAVGPNAAEGALDGRVDTRWGTGSPQRPGQSFEVAFVAPVELQALRYDLGAWEHDYPRGLELYLQRLDGSWERVLSAQDVADIRYILREQSGFTVRLPGRQTQAVRLVQQGLDARMDWSIAELELFVHE